MLNRFPRHLRLFVWSLLLGGFMTASAPAAKSVYIVKRGDTLVDIAQNHNLTVAALAERNGLPPDYHVKVGERLTISSPDKTAAAQPSGDTTYVVKRGDTLFDLAKANGLSVDELARRNGLDQDYELKTGEHLTLPATAGTASKATSPSPSGGLPAAISSAIRNAPVTEGRWKYIVIHHSGVDEGTVKGMDRYHREVRHMENGLAYHFVIGNGQGMGNGEIAVGNRWKKQLDGGHLASLAQDKVAIGICLVGNFDKSAPSAAEMKSLNELVRALMERCDISAGNVKTHQQINIIGTRCPGSKFPTKSFLAGLKT
jgi:LysM repeat protein